MKEAMTWLGQQPDTIFLGQGVGCGGTKMGASFDGVPADRRLEFPVAENLQLGVAIGLSLEGFAPISVFPRLDFLMVAMDQLLLHLDKMPLFSGYRPKVIIRTAVGRKEPLDAGPQHTGDYVLPLVAMLKTITVRPLRPGMDALRVYQEAYHHHGSTLIVEG